MSAHIDCLRSFVCTKGRILRCIHQLSFHGFLMCLSPAGLLIAFCPSLLSCVMTLLTHVSQHFRPARLFALSYCGVVLSGHAVNRARACECAVSVRAQRSSRPFITSAQEAHFCRFDDRIRSAVLSLSFHECPYAIRNLTNTDTLGLCNTQTPFKPF